jgi:hypothetical protein
VAEASKRQTTAQNIVPKEALGAEPEGALGPDGPEGPLGPEGPPLGGAHVVTLVYTGGTYELRKSLHRSSVGWHSVNVFPPCVYEKHCCSSGIMTAGGDENEVIGLGAVVVMVLSTSTMSVPTRSGLMVFKAMYESKMRKIPPITALIHDFALPLELTDSLVIY